MIKHFLKNKKNYSNDELQFFRRQVCAKSAPSLRQVCAKSAPSLRQVCLILAVTLFNSFSFVANAQFSVKGTVEKWTSTNGMDPVKNVQVSIFPVGGGFSQANVNNSNGQYFIPWNPTIQGTTEYTFFIQKFVAVPNTHPWLNGVSTFDLTLMTKHILATQPFSTGFQRIAADVNRNGTVSTADVVELRKLILAIQQTNNFWNDPIQFVPKRITQAGGSSFDANPNNFSIYVNGVLTPQSYTSTSGYFSPFNYRLKFLNTSEGFGLQSQPSCDKCGFWGVQIGDVNGNFNSSKVTAPNNGEKELAIKSEERSSTVSYSQSNPILANQEATLLVRSSNFNDITAFQMGLGFDKSKVEILGSEAADLDWISDESFGLTHLDEGEFRMLAFHPSGEVASMKDDEVLYKIHIRALEDINDISQVINFNDEILQTIFYYGEGSEASDIAINFEVINGENTAKTVKTYPNPSNGNVSFEFDSELAGKAEMELINFTGSNILTQENVVSKGKNTMSLDITNQNTGHYFYKLKLPNKVLTGRIIKK